MYQLETQFKSKKALNAQYVPPYLQEKERKKDKSAALINANGFATVQQLQLDVGCDHAACIVTAGGHLDRDIEYIL